MGAGSARKPAQRTVRDASVLQKARENFASGKPIRWQRVAQLPDYVHFDHSIHINRGVACAECHGRIDQMPLTARAKPFEMKFCLDCHRDPAPHLGPPERQHGSARLERSGEARLWRTGDACPSHPAGTAR